MVFGRVAQERLQLNEDTLWSGSPYTPDNPEALAGIQEIRKLLNAKRYQEATELASAKSHGETVAADVVRESRRRIPELPGCTDSRALRTRSRARDGHRHHSVPHEVGSVHERNVRIEPTPGDRAPAQAPKGKLSFDVGYRTPRPVKYTPPDYQGPATVLAVEEPIDWLIAEAPGELTPDVRASSDVTRCLLITGRNTAGPDTPAGLTFALRLRVVSDGRIVAQNGRLSVHDARTATSVDRGRHQLCELRKCERRPDRNSQAPHGQRRSGVVRFTQTGTHSRVPVALRGHVTRASRHSRGPTNPPMCVSPMRRHPTIAALAALYFQFARYLLISSSRPGCQPANLQGSGMRAPIRRGVANTPSTSTRK